MKVRNMLSSRGNKVANQFTIQSANKEVFQSYDSIIAERYANGDIWLDDATWDYSVTTSRYRNIFLGETKKETQAKIDSGEYVLANLNP